MGNNKITIYLGGDNVKQLIKELQTVIDKYATKKETGLTVFNVGHRSFDSHYAALKQSKIYHHADYVCYDVKSNIAIWSQNGKYYIADPLKGDLSSLKPICEVTLDAKVKRRVGDVMWWTLLEHSAGSLEIQPNTPWEALRLYYNGRRTMNADEHLAMSNRLRTTRQRRCGYVSHIFVDTSTKDVVWINGGSLYESSLSCIDELEEEAVYPEKLVRRPWFKLDMRKDVINAYASMNPVLANLLAGKEETDEVTHIGDIQWDGPKPYAKISNTDKLPIVQMYYHNLRTIDNARAYDYASRLSLWDSRVSHAFVDTNTLQCILISNGRIYVSTTNCLTPDLINDAQVISIEQIAFSTTITWDLQRDVAKAYASIHPTLVQLLTWKKEGK